MLLPKKQLSKLLKNKRLEKGLSKYRVAELAKLSRNTVSQVEEGEREYTYEVAYKISKVLFCNDK